MEHKIEFKALKTQDGPKELEARVILQNRTTLPGVQVVGYVTSFLERYNFFLCGEREMYAECKIGSQEFNEGKPVIKISPTVDHQLMVGLNDEALKLHPQIQFYLAMPNYVQFRSPKATYEVITGKRDLTGRINTLILKKYKTAS